MKVAVGEIMLGFRLEDQKLLDKGHEDMYVVQAFIIKMVLISIMQAEVLIL